MTNIICNFLRLNIKKYVQRLSLQTDKLNTSDQDINLAEANLCLRGTSLINQIIK